MLNSIIIFLSDDDKILLKKAFGNNLSLSLNDELTSDEYCFFHFLTIFF